MGRVGTLHAWEQEGVVPSIQTIGKGLGGGYVPIAGILVGHDVVKVLDDGTGSVLDFSPTPIVFVASAYKEVGSSCTVTHTKAIP